MRGRKPKPTPLKIIEGNPGRRPLPENEPVAPEGEIKCPSWLHGRARKVWREMAPISEKMGVLTVADVPAFAAWCEVHAEFIEAREDVRKRGQYIKVTHYTAKGEPYTETELNPSVKIASDADKRAKAREVEFGLTASSRSRVKAAPKPKEQSPLEKLMGRKQA